MNCLICNKYLSDKYSENSNMGLPVFYCRDCNLYVTGSSVDELKEKSSKIYTKDYWDNRKAESAINSDYNDQNSQGKKRQWFSQIKYCKEYLRDAKTILEIGSGPGQTLYWFSQENYDVTGIEPDERNVRLINKKLKNGKCIVGFAEETEIKGSFDIIWLSHVFEHLVRPIDLLCKLKNNLKLGGKIFIEVPNCENSIILHSSVFNHPSSFHFSKNSLMKLVKKAGYNIEKCDCLRSPTKVEGAINKICTRLNINRFYPYYPKIIANNRKGTDIRIIISL